MSHIVYVHCLSGGPCDGDKVPNHRPWEQLTITKPCENHKDSYAEDQDCPNCKKHNYIKEEQEGIQEVDYPELEVITPDGVDKSPVMHRVNMRYKNDS